MTTGHTVKLGFSGGPFFFLRQKKSPFYLLRDWIPFLRSNRHIPSQGTFEDDFPFPKVGYVSFSRGVDLDPHDNHPLNISGRGLLHSVFTPDLYHALGAVCGHQLLELYKNVAP